MRSEEDQGIGPCPYCGSTYPLTMVTAYQSITGKTSYAVQCKSGLHGHSTTLRYGNCDEAIGVWNLVGAAFRASRQRHE